MLKKSPFIELVKYLPSDLRRRLMVLAPLLGVSGVLEVVSLASLIPLGTALLTPVPADHWLYKFGWNGLDHSGLLALLATITVALFSAKALFVFLVTRYALHTAAKARAFFQCFLFESYVGAQYTFHLSRNSSEYLRNITTECNALDARFLTPIVVLAAEVIPVMFILVFLLIINPWGLIVSSATFLVSGLLIIKLSAKKLQLLGAKQIECDGKFVKLAQQSFHSPKEICIYQVQDKLVQKAKKYTDESAVTVAKALTFSNFPRFLLEITSLLAVILVAAIAMHQGSSTQALIVELGIFFGAVVKLLPSSSRIVSHFQALNHSRPTVANIVNELTNSRRETHNHNQTESVKNANANIGHFKSIQTEQLAFSYNGSDYLLSDVSFTICQGEVIGLMGETGSGKTTLVNILLGLIPPTKGDVLVNGTPLSTARPAWSRLVSYVPQEIYILDDTIAENVAFFESREELDVPRIMQALDTVGMADFVSSMEQGVFTKLGEHGSRLSGGQRQRIGIARALYRNPDVIFLDEATSALDNQTEAAITESVSGLKGKKTIIMIAHRMSSLRFCDKVLRLSNGTIEEMTAHQFSAAYQV